MSPCRHKKEVVGLSLEGFRQARCLRLSANLVLLFLLSTAK